MPSIYPVVQNIDQAVDFSGHALNRHLDLLDGLSEKHGVPQLSEFVYVDMEEFGNIVGEDFDIPDQQEWFEPNDGLLAVNCLLENIEENDPDLEGLHSDLMDLQSVLERAKEHGNLWQLQHDI